MISLPVSCVGDAVVVVAVVEVNADVAVVTVPLLLLLVMVEGGVGAEAEVLHGVVQFAAFVTHSNVTASKKGLSTGHRKCLQALSLAGGHPQV